MNAEKLKKQLAQHAAHTGAPPLKPAPDRDGDGDQSGRPNAEQREKARQAKFGAPKTKPGEQDDVVTSAEELADSEKPGQVRQKPKSAVQMELDRVRRPRR